MVFILNQIVMVLVKVSKRTRAYSVKRNESKKVEKSRRRKRIVPRH